MTGQGTCCGTPECTSRGTCSQHMPTPVPNIGIQSIADPMGTLIQGQSPARWPHPTSSVLCACGKFGPRPGLAIGPCCSHDPGRTWAKTHPVATSHEVGCSTARQALGRRTQHSGVLECKCNYYLCRRSAMTTRWPLRAIPPDPLPSQLSPGRRGRMVLAYYMVTNRRTTRELEDRGVDSGSPRASPRVTRPLNARQYSVVGAQRELNRTVRDRLDGWNRNSKCNTRAAVGDGVMWRCISSNLGLRVDDDRDTIQCRPLCSVCRRKARAHRLWMHSLSGLWYR